MQGFAVTGIEQHQLRRMPIELAGEAAVRALENEPFALLPASARVFFHAFVSEMNLLIHGNLSNYFSVDVVTLLQLYALIA
jgi:hypothetical protein